ncbi:hypothetical protein AGMMS50239_35460 [Bacteroidia bacterium]|nr:hypothetical protein AGMMS50239_35460 [Bacteroidia bacterium]
MEKENWFPLIEIGGKFEINWEKHTWKVIIIALIIISGVFLIIEHMEYSSNFCIVTVCILGISFLFVLLLKACHKDDFKNKYKFKNMWELFPLLTIIGLLVSVDNDVVTQSDGQLLNVLKRIYVKETKVDVSQEFNKYTMPKLVIVLDMSGSTQSEKIGKDNLFYKETEIWHEKLKSALTTAGVQEDNMKNFLGKINSQKSDLTEYDVYKSRLLEFVSKVQKNYEINIVCFGTYPIPSPTYICSDENRYLLDDIFYFINKCEKDIGNQQKTDFVRLFEKLMDEYDCEGKSFDFNEAPQYSFVFFSDYIHESIKPTSEEDIEDIVNKFSNSPNFNNFYYFKWKDYTKENNGTKKDFKINVYPVLQQFFNGYNGNFSPLTRNYLELFNISSTQIIPVW